MNRLFILVVLTFLFLFTRAYRYNESFVDVSCEEYDTCVSCANKSRCTWCSSSKKCLTKSEIGNTDALCNQINLIYSPAMCPVESHTTRNPSIESATPPPMVYMNHDMTYSPETVMANVSDLRKEVQVLKQAFRCM